VLCGVHGVLAVWVSSFSLNLTERVPDWPLERERVGLVSPVVGGGLTFCIVLRRRVQVVLGLLPQWPVWTLLSPWWCVRVSIVGGSFVLSVPDVVVVV